MSSVYLFYGSSYRRFEKGEIVSLFSRIVKWKQEIEDWEDMWNSCITNRLGLLSAENLGND
jgi:hypothetical protein